MRFLFIPILASALPLSGNTRCVVQPDEPRPIVVLVHGRGQFGFDSAATRREWKRDLDSALTLVGLPRLRDEDVKLAWYADVLDPQSTEACISQRGRGTDLDELGLASFARGFLASLTSVMSDSGEAFGARALLGDILYFVDRDARCAAEERVAGVLASAAKEGRPVIVVAYSLGSLVTYGYLSRAPAAKLPRDIRLVTLGSPLGIREIRELLLDSDSDSLPPPAGVKSWDNIYDPDDFLSAPLQGKIAFKELRDHPTELSSDEGAHQISRYLRDRSIGAAVGRAICATQKQQFKERCAKL